MKKINAALISVFYKDGLETLLPVLHAQGVKLYSTGGTQAFIEQLGLPVTPVEALTSYPAILGGRVKTLHPGVFGGILGKRANHHHIAEMAAYSIPEIDLVMVDLYPFEATVAAYAPDAYSAEAHAAIVEKVDIGGPSMIRAAAKNYHDVVVIAQKSDYGGLANLLQAQAGATSLEQRRQFATKAFQVVAQYDVAIAHYFQGEQQDQFFAAVAQKSPLRYGENPHQAAVFYGNLDLYFTQLHGKALSFNNLVDVDAAVHLIQEFGADGTHCVFGIIKHTNVCGIAARASTSHAWEAALAGDPESAFGGVLVTNGTVDLATATAINEIFFEVLLAPAFTADALGLLQAKKNRILLQLTPGSAGPRQQFRSMLGGVLTQGPDEGNVAEWQNLGGRPATEAESSDLLFANLVCKHLKSNAIALVKDRQLVGKGCGQTSRIDALRQAIEKARQFGFELQGAVLASDAFFPFDDCIKIAHTAGIQAFIQPGGSIRDKDSVAYAQAENLALVMTGMRHFKH
jgi:phosphoribosylaminoimidazolecarboxamide formyltransferase / IMP cyclohydrolase